MWADVSAPYTCTTGKHAWFSENVNAHCHEPMSRKNTIAYLTSPFALLPYPGSVLAAHEQVQFKIIKKNYSSDKTTRTSF